MRRRHGEVCGPSDLTGNDPEETQDDFLVQTICKRIELGD